MLSKCNKLYQAVQDMYSPGRIFCVLATSSLVACGGGGGGSGGDAARDTASNTATQGEALDSLETTPVLSGTSTSDGGAASSGSAVQEAPSSPTSGGAEQVSQEPTSTPTLDVAAAVPLRPAVRSEDILVAVRASRSAEFGAGRLQCMGQNVLSSTVTNGLYGTGASGLTELKHGLADVVPLKAFHFAVWKGDPNTSGTNTQRCERYFAASNQLIPQRTDVWFGVKTKVSEWASGTNRIIWQWHEDSPTSGLSPHLAAMVNGRTLRIIAHYNNASTLSRETTTAVVLYSTNQWQPEVWNEFLVKAKVDPDPAGSGYVDVWLNGNRVVQYRGAIGYRYDVPRDYAKFGLYHWNTATNQWRAGDAETVRASYTGMVLVRHSAGYTHDSIAEMLN